MTIDPARALADLRVDAPIGLDLDVLLAVDLADHTTRVRLRTEEDLVVAWNSTGISATEFAGRDAQTHLEAQLDRPVVDDASTMPSRLRAALDRVLRSGRVGSLPLDQRGVSEFHRAALAAAASIPPGEVRPYGWIARELGRPGAARAVGTAMATNRMPVLLPCHRVVPSDGSLGKYTGGVRRKRSLLEAEGLDVVRLEAGASSGVRFVADETTGVFCYPTCQSVRRIADRNRIELRTATEAFDRGLRACPTCRPA